jgi:hypothetical protein
MSVFHQTVHAHLEYKYIHEFCFQFLIFLTQFFNIHEIFFQFFNILNLFLDKRSICTSIKVHFRIFIINEGKEHPSDDLLA